MADKSINELVAASAISASDLFVLEQNATAKKLTGQVLINFLTAAADGHGGISSFAKTGTAGLVDTYTITYADASTSTFTITNGAKGDTGQAYYVWIRYSAAQPTQDSDIGATPDNWMGIYTGASATAPTAYAAYTWYEIKGAKGDTGTAASITSQTVTYQASISGTVVPTGTWQSAIPAVTQGNYLWTRTVITFNDNTSITSYSVGRMGVDGQGSPSSTTPNAAGTATVGDETTYARGDHIHPKELTDGSVTTAKIAENAVTLAKLASDVTAALGGVSIVKLWENASPGSEFAEQTVSISGLSAYQMVLVVFRYSTTSDKEFTAITQYAYQGECSATYSFTEMVIRQFTPNDTGVLFTGGENHGTGFLIPKSIYGVKGVV